jgi:hypothetical protein
MKSEMKSVVGELMKEYEPLLKELAPCGETPEAAWADKTSFQINAPRALMMCAFQAQVSLLAILKKRGMLAKRET